ncbi:unnamed protein product [Cladocopium goreaui]|uniref:Major facilitator superfamily (MFS) profile domain-containing protein n=1 Tax=Cladocopium goreaui TaxID=2562237 RepID=A0A9P1FH93_9DINO|nr:unnamed protein product [Cladocopium goreaui]
MAAAEQRVEVDSEDIESTDFGSTCSDRRVYLKETLHFLRLTWPLLLGNTLEWYEFGVYSYVEHEIAENFFEGSSLGAWLGYAVTFIARPLGGIILGIIADHYGRKLSVNLSLGGMIVATVAQGCLPGKYFGGKFQGLGFGLLMIFRALQGLSAGGEIGAVTAYLMEVSPVQTLGMAVCMISIGSQTAWAFASALLAVLNQALGSEAMLVWGWRIPFLFSALPGALAMWGRNRIQETDVFLSEVRNDEGHKQQHVCKSIMELLIHYPVVLLIGILGVCCAATMWFAPPFWSINAVLGHLAASDALWVGLCCQLVGLAVTPVAGWFTDLYGVAMTTCVGAMYTTLVGFPAYLMLVVDSSRATAYLGVGLFFGIAQGFNGATIYLFCAELFPARLRCQGIALSYNIGMSFLGGFAAAISQAFYQLDDLFPGIYWTCTGIVTVVTIFVALSLYDRDWVKLTHRRSEPYFGKSIMPTIPTMPPPRLKMRGRS